MASKNPPLSIVNPILAKEWNYDRNAPLTPDEVTSGSNKKVWWICSTCKHESRIETKNGIETLTSISDEEYARCQQVLKEMIELNKEEDDKISLVLKDETAYTRKERHVRRKEDLIYRAGEA